MISKILSWQIDLPFWTRSGPTSVWIFVVPFFHLCHAEKKSCLRMVLPPKAEFRANKNTKKSTDNKSLRFSFNCRITIAKHHPSFHSRFYYFRRPDVCDFLIRPLPIYWSKLQQIVNVRRVISAPTIFLGNWWELWKAWRLIGIPLKKWIAYLPTVHQGF